MLTKRFIIQQDTLLYESVVHINRNKTEINHLQLQFDSNKETAQIKTIIISTEEMLKDLPFEEKVS